MFIFCYPPDGIRTASPWLVIFKVDALMESTTDAAISHLPHFRHLSLGYLVRAVGHESGVDLGVLELRVLLLVSLDGLRARRQQANERGFRCCGLRK